MNVSAYVRSVIQECAPKPRRTIVVEVDDLLRLQPGYCLELTLETGERFTVMHTDDATHVLSLGGLAAIDNGRDL